MSNIILFHLYVLQCNLTKSSFQCLRYLMQLDAMLTPGSEKLSANCTSGWGRVGRRARPAVRDIAPIGGSPHKEESTGPHQGPTTNIQHQIQPHHQNKSTLVFLDRWGEVKSRIQCYFKWKCDEMRWSEMESCCFCFNEDKFPAKDGFEDTNWRHRCDWG